MTDARVRRSLLFAAVVLTGAAFADGVREVIPVRDEAEAAGPQPAPRFPPPVPPITQPAPQVPTQAPASEAVEAVRPSETPETVDDVGPAQEEWADGRAPLPAEDASWQWNGCG